MTTTEMTIPRPEILTPVPENIPRELRRRPQWVVWRLELRGEKWTKVPYTPTGRAASHSDLMTWHTFPEVLLAYEGGSCHGIGFVFSSGDPYCGLDLDGCRDPETGKVEEWAQEIVDLFAEGGYVELSATGTGIHIILRGKATEVVKTDRLELYDMRRFFTITGRVL
jgi:putative DNA primase/helicase